jgi:hypothetical protein
LSAAVGTTTVGNVVSRFRNSSFFKYGKDSIFNNTRDPIMQEKEHFKFTIVEYMGALYSIIFK